MSSSNDNPESPKTSDTKKQSCISSQIHSTPVMSHGCATIVPSDISSVTTSDDDKSSSSINSELISSVNNSISKFQQLSLSLASSSISFDLSSSDSEKESAELHVTKKARKDGKKNEWTIFKPKHQRLYGRILEQSADVLQNEAIRWAQQYQIEPSQAVADLLQLIIDVCGHQSIDISKVFKFEKTYYDAFILYMEKNPPDFMSKNGKYLMKGTSTFCKNSQLSIYSFTNSLIKMSDQFEILYDQKMIRHLLNFLFTLLRSNSRSMVHSGLVIAIKLYTALKELCINKKSELDANLESSSDFSRMQQLQPINQQIAFLSKMLQHLQDKIESKCTLRDSAMFNMKLVCVEEMWKWFKLDPETLTNTKYFRRLLNYVVDESSKVRLAALTICYKLIKTTRFERQLNSLMEAFVKTVSGRFNDIDKDVVKYVFCICIKLVETYPQSLSVELRSNIYLVVFGKSHTFAVEAGKFMLAFTRSKCSTNDPTKIINSFINFAETTQTTYPIALFVESIIKNCSEIREWEIIIRLLTNNTLDCSKQVVLVNILCETVYQILVGESRICREAEINEELWSVEDIRNVSEIFLKNINSLLRQFSENIECLRILVEVLLLINFEDKMLHVDISIITNCIQTLRSLFVKKTYNDYQFCETISKIFAKLCENNSAYKLSAKPIVQTAISAFIDLFIISSNNIESSNKQIEVERNDSITLRLSCLIKYHDVTNTITYSALFQNWLTYLEKNYYVAVKYKILCGCWYLIWQLKNLVIYSKETFSEITITQQIDDLLSSYEHYVKICFDLLKPSIDSEIFDTVLDCIFDLIWNYFILLEDLRDESDIIFKTFIPAIQNKKLQDELTSFSIKFILEDIDKSFLKSKRNKLIKMFNMISKDVMDVKYLSLFYKYYGLRYASFGDIFDENLKNLENLKQEQLVPVIVLNSMIETYDDIVVRNEPWENLKNLTKQFFSYFTKKYSDLELLVLLGIKFAVQKKNNYSFLNYLKLYGTPLPQERKNYILKYFKEHTSSLDQNDKTFKTFVSYINTAKVRSKRVSQLSNASNNKELLKEMSEDSLMSYEIEDDSQ